MSNDRPGEASGAPFGGGDAAGGDDVLAKEPSRETEAALSGIFATVRTKTGHDFSCYKVNTVLRRIQRRMSVHALEELDGYAGLLRESHQEADLLCREILISVTSFFRDPEAFELVRQEIVPRLFEARAGDDPVRIWHPCCATGEEVYSMAMLIREYLDEAGLDVKVQFFATDLDEEAIAQARLGLYSDEVVGEVGEERLKRFFTRIDHQWQVSKQLRESVIFAQHSLIKDPPFSRLDLLVCRNFLIYINSELQKRLVSLFHQVLRPGRFLFLGSAETVGNDCDLFAPLDKRWKIYQRTESGRRSEVSFPFSASFRRPAGRAVRSTESELSPGAAADRLLSERYAPPYVVVNEKYEVVHVSPRADRFLRVPPGEPTRDLLRMALDELRPPLRAAIYKALSEEQQVVFRGVKVRNEGSRLNVVVDQVRAGAGQLALVVFESASEPPAAAPGSLAPATDEAGRDLLVRQLEEQLQITHEQLMAVTEQLESSHEGFLSANEELMSINEEFQSANEELQSTNEELETSKEELQALNEELVTVNAELQAKVEELDQANDDMENLLTSAEIATLFLDRQLLIKRYTPAMAELFNLIPSDVGRPFVHFAGGAEWSPLARAAESVLADRVPQEREVAAPDGRHYLMRVLPYRSSAEVVDGVVVTLVEISERKKMEDALLRARDEWERTFNAVPDLIAIIDDQHRITRANRAMAERLGSTPEGCVGQSCYRNVHCSESPDPQCPHSRTLRDGREHWAEIHEERLQGAFLVTTTPLFDDNGAMSGSVHVARDITERKRSEEELRRSKVKSDQQLAQLQAILDHLTDGVVISDLEGNLYHWNPAAVAMHGFSSIDECRRSLADFPALLEVSTAQGEFLPLERWPMSRVLSGETLRGWEVRVRRRDTDWSRVFSYRGTLACDKEGNPILAVLSITDVTELKDAEALIRRHVEDLEANNDELTRFNNVSVGRELRMIELKKEINDLCRRVGESDRYPLEFEEQ